MALDSALASMVRLAFGFDNRQNGDGHCVAPSRFLSVLDLEGSPRSNRTAPIKGNAEPDSHHQSDNPLWDAPRIHSELLKLGLNLSQGSVAK